MSFLGDANKDKTNSTEFKMLEKGWGNLSSIFESTKKDIDKIKESDSTEVAPDKENTKELESKINLLIDSINKISSSTTSTNLIPMNRYFISSKKSSPITFCKEVIKSESSSVYSISG